MNNITISIIYWLGYVVSAIILFFVFLFTKDEKGEEKFGLFGSFGFAIAVSFLSWVGFVVGCIKAGQMIVDSLKNKEDESSSENEESTPLSAFDAHTLSSSHQYVKKQNEEKAVNDQMRYILYCINSAGKKGEYSTKLHLALLEGTRKKLTDLGYKLTFGEDRIPNGGSYVQINWENVKKL